MNVLVVYFSRTGRVRKAARAIAGEMGAGITEMQAKKSYRGLIGFVRGGYDSVKDRRVLVRPISEHLSDYELIVVGSPVWAGKLSAPAKSFIMNNLAKIKSLGLFIVHADAKNSYASIFREIENSAGLTLAAELSLRSHDVEQSTADYSAFVRKLQENE